MGEQINFDRLGPIYTSAMKNARGTIAFEVRLQRGVFVFMMFLEQKMDKESSDSPKDILFLFLKKSNHLRKIKLWGSHKNGDFFIYLNKELEDAIRRELGIKGAADIPFDFAEFMRSLNDNIPDNVSFDDFRKTLRDNIRAVDTDHTLIDEEEKIYLSALIHLPDNKHPREQTLRKLYLYVDAERDVVDLFIKKLREKNCTLGWSAEKQKDVSVLTLMNAL